MNAALGSLATKVTNHIRVGSLPVMWVRQYSRDRGRDSIDEAEASQGRGKIFEAEVRQSENHVNVLTKFMRQHTHRKRLACFLKRCFYIDDVLS